MFQSESFSILTPPLSIHNTLHYKYTIYLKRTQALHQNNHYL